ncbi:hypothetical protein SMICM304S_09630 [Streptomyces microflavus]
MYPNLASADAAFATIVKDELPVGVRGLVLDAAGRRDVHVLRGADRLRDRRQQRHLVPVAGGRGAEWGRGR